ncbi:hypothetical protein ACA910_002640 [Epithemia clementina (nom. ined.)]
MPLLRKAIWMAVPFLLVVFVWEDSSVNGPSTHHTANDASATSPPPQPPRTRASSSRSSEQEHNNLVVSNQNYNEESHAAASSDRTDFGVDETTDDGFGFNEELEQLVYDHGQDFYGGYHNEDLKSATKPMDKPKVGRKNDDDDDDDPMADSNADLIRPRPRNLRLVFVGDSLTRYQYLSLAYWLRYGRWFDPSVYPNNLVNAHSFHHNFHPSDDWNEFFIQSNRMLQPNELCDCSRQENLHVAVERRYFREDIRNNTLVYINVSGESTLGHNGLYGRVDPHRVFPNNNDNRQQEQQQQGTFRSGLIADDETENEWEFRNWGDLIRRHVGRLNMGGPSAVAILNAGLHPHRFDDSLRTVSLKVALEDVGIMGVWKTTTFRKDQLSVLSSENNNNNNNNNDYNSREKQQDLRQPYSQMSPIDQQMCSIMDDCLDLSWMAQLNPDLYYDNLHFNEPVYRILNEELLSKLHLLPANYQPLDRSIVLNRQA